MIWGLALVNVALASDALLHSFAGDVGGAMPTTDLIINADGTMLYGMTRDGGIGDHGTIFKITTAGGVFEVIHNFVSSYGQVPIGGLILGDDGYLYGTLAEGGDGEFGTIFRIATNAEVPSTIEILHSFSGYNSTAADADGAHPNGNLILSGDYLYGMTSIGGTCSDCTDDGDPEGCGTIFRIHKVNVTDYAILHHFTDETNDGSRPEGSLTLDGTTLYGMTTGGGDSYNGTIFKIAKDATPASLSLIHI